MYLGFLGHQPPSTVAAVDPVWGSDQVTRPPDSAAPALPAVAEVLVFDFLKVYPLPNCALRLGLLSTRGVL